VRIGIVGKGGVGKTTVAALLAAAYAERGRRVVAIDTDSNPNLGLSLGLDLEAVDSLPALPRSTIVGDGRGEHDAASLVDTYGAPTPAGPRLLTGLRVEEAGAGCACGGHATVRSLLAEALELDADVTVVDMEAGLEHLSRSGGTLAAVDLLVAVVEPSRKSVVTAARTRRLADDLGIPRTVVLANKVRDAADARFVVDACEAQDLEIVGRLPHEEAVRDADRAGARLDPGRAPGLRDELDAVLERLDDLVATPA
jgi:CO dehydrogenase maturation factor